MKAVNWLVIGIGDISRKRAIPAILSEPHSRLHSILTRDPAKARDYPDAHIYTDLDDALANRSVDAVYIATPVSLHEAQTIAALKRGKHVLCEKPAALDFGAAVRMRDAAVEAGKLHGVAYYRRFFPQLLDAKRRIAAGEIGVPVLGEANCHGWLPAADRGWLLDPKLSGAGPLYDIACHRIDALNFLLGTPRRATGLVSNVVHSLSVEDSATVLIDYESGPRAIVDVRWNSRIERDQFRIVGTEGAIDLTPLSGGAKPPFANVHYPLIENFVAACLGEAELVCPIEESLKTDRVLHAVRFEQPLDSVHA
ncbi:MAG TPA: Gfo/Idh/MocA family oxidoreductase [Bryobacteraceae bacterium]|jgi:predicted dehydrogenase